MMCPHWLHGGSAVFNISFKHYGPTIEHKGIWIQRVNQESNSCYIEIIYDNFSLIVMRKYIHAFGDVVCNPKGTKGCAFPVFIKNNFIRLVQFKEWNTFCIWKFMLDFSFLSIACNKEKKNLRIIPTISSTNLILYH